ncbi:MAG: DUF1273 domain-containing protein [Ruminiclostridium sp.]|nr:DUF1273 domain-containing protein [Ruminiclostridium sp.]
MEIEKNLSTEENLTLLEIQREEKLKSASFSGHRILPKDCGELKKSLTSEIKRLIESGVVNFWAGGALGFDMLAEETVIELKKEYPDINLGLILPCTKEDQTLKWTQKQKDRYDAIFEHTDRVKLVTFEYTRECMLERNRHLVDSSQYLICYLRRNRGGTFYTVNYAEKQNTKIICL